MSEGKQKMATSDGKRKPKFRVGQVVRIDVPYYKAKPRRAEQYQRITRVWPWPWPKCKGTPFGYDFLNGDRANEKYLKPLTAKERGRLR